MSSGEELCSMIWRLFFLRIKYLLRAEKPLQSRKVGQKIADVKRVFARKEATQR